MIKGRRMKHLRVWRAASWLLLLPLVWGGCAVNPVSGEHQVMLLSEPQEAQLGRQTDVEIVQGYGLYEDDKLRSYLDDFCTRLGRLSHRANLPYQVKVLDSPVVNAFAVPGGYVYFTRGILAYLNSEAELAGVMGHEIGHIAARHSAQQYSRAQLATMGLNLGMMFSTTLRTFGDAAQMGIGLLFLKFSRDDERQADDLGVEYSTRAGYDANQMARFFETLERMNPGSGRDGLPAWFSTHPNPEDRQGAIHRAAKEWQERVKLGRPAVNREAYLKRIDGLIFGDDPREGFVEGQVFYHPLLKFQFPVPAQWKVENTRSAVQMTSPNEDAAISFTMAQGNSLKDVVDGFLQNSRASVIQSGRMDVNGLSGHRLITRIQTQKGPLMVLSCFIEKDKAIAMFHGFAGPSRFQGLVPTFDHTMGQFRRLGDPSKTSVKPDRIIIRPAPVSGTVAQVLQSLGVTQEGLQAVALLNGMRLEDKVASNTLMKVVGK